MNTNMWTTLYNNVNELNDLDLELAAILPIYVFMPGYLNEFYNLRQKVKDINPELNRCDNPECDVEPLVEKTSDLINEYTDLTVRIEEAIFDPDSDYSIQSQIDAHPDRDTIMQLQRYLNDTHYDSNMVAMTGEEVRYYYSNYKEFYNYAISSAHSHHVVLPNPRLYNPNDLIIEVYNTLIMPILDTNNFFTVYHKEITAPHT